MICFMYYVTAHPARAYLGFHLTASMSKFEFMAEVHYEAVRILTLHSANVNIADALS